MEDKLEDMALTKSQGKWYVYTPRYPNFEEKFFSKGRGKNIGLNRPAVVLFHLRNVTLDGFKNTVGRKMSLGVYRVIST